MFSAAGRRRFQAITLSPLLAILFLVLTISLAGCHSVDPVVKVGLVAPFEGAERRTGYDVIFSARLAVREINASGGIAGTRVALVALDDRADRSLAEDAAASLIIDPQVVAVVGHWQEETTQIAAARYADEGMPFFPLAGAAAQYDAAALPAEFVRAYTAVAPFDEQPGPYAAVTYDAFQFLWAAMEEAAVHDGISRAGILATWEEVSYSGITGLIAAPAGRGE